MPMKLLLRSILPFSSAVTAISFPQMVDRSLAREPQRCPIALGNAAPRRFWRLMAILASSELRRDNRHNVRHYLRARLCPEREIGSQHYHSCLIPHLDGQFP
jgi:hypothetical protein